MKRIALSGKPLAGKSTLARVLKEKHGYRHASMSGVIVDEVIKNLNRPWMPPDLTAQDIYENKEKYRVDLQVAGDNLGFQDPSKIIHIIQRALSSVGAWDHPEEPVVLEAIRGEMQASAARALGFVVVNLWIDEDEQQRRAGDEETYELLKESMRARPDIECGVSSAAITLTQALPVEDQAMLLVLSPEEGIYHGPADQLFIPGSRSNWK